MYQPVKTSEEIDVRLLIERASIPSFDDCTYSELQQYEREYADTIREIVKEPPTSDSIYRVQTYELGLKAIDRRHRLLMFYSLAKSISLVLSALSVVAVAMALVYYVVVPYWSWVWFGCFIGVYVAANGYGISSCTRSHTTPMSFFSVNTVASFICIGFAYQNFDRGIRFHVFIYTFTATTLLYIVSIIVGLSVYFYVGEEESFSEQEA